MSHSFRTLLGVSALCAVWTPIGTARAQCCQGYSPATACAGAALTKSRWCIQDNVPTGQQALTAQFCAYGDVIVSTLQRVFNISAPDVFEFELDSKTGGAHTGTSCGHFGDGVAYDAFTGSAYGATGFWGYLLSLHEAINDWTGMSSSGWPTDFWADHQSAFPNLMDFHVMNTIGVANGDQNLIKAAAAQKTRFYPNGDSADAKVVALDNVFSVMPNADGYAGFSNVFSLQSGDGVKWDGLGVPNPDVKRTEYVAAYMSLAARENVLQILQGPGANGGGNICNDTPDGTAADKPYTCDAGHIDTIATAHCAIAANGKRSADLSMLRSGSYTNIPSGPCGGTCPAECACDDNMHCVASWLGTRATDGGSGGAINGGGGTSTSAGGTSTQGSGNGGTTAPTGTGGSNAPGSAGNAGQSANTGTAGQGASSGASGQGGGAGSGEDASSNSSCGCRMGDGNGAARNALWFAASLGTIALTRRRRRSD